MISPQVTSIGSITKVPIFFQICCNRFPYRHSIPISANPYKCPQRPCLRKSLSWIFPLICFRDVAIAYLPGHEVREMSAILIKTCGTRTGTLSCNGRTCANSHESEIEEDIAWDGNGDVLETSPNDKLFGIGYATEQAFENKDRWGENKLEKALMRVRGQLAQWAVSHFNATINNYRKNVVPKNVLF